MRDPSTAADPVPGRSAPALPRPFERLPWWGAEREAARAFWRFHHALTDPQAPRLDGDDLAAYFEAEKQHAAAAEPLGVVPEGVWRAAYDACDAHDLPPALLARQVGAARRFARRKIRFATTSALDGWLRKWACAHGLLLARLAGAGHAWQERSVSELARGFFLASRLLRLPHDLHADRFFFPEDDLDVHMRPADLRDGPPKGEAPPEDVQRFLWKQDVRARDALAQGQEGLRRELPSRHGWTLRAYWHGALDVLGQLEARNYDVWNGSPIRLSWWRRGQVVLQATLGR